MFDLNNFISKSVTKRVSSMFLPDIEANSEKLYKIFKAIVYL